MQTKTEIMINDIQEELERVKMFTNKGYNHGTSINQIVRRYRNELKEYLGITIMDLDLDVIKDYKDC